MNKCTPLTITGALVVMLMTPSAGKLSAQSHYKIPIKCVSGAMTINLELGVNGDGPGGSIVDNSFGFDGPPYATVDPAFEDLVAPPAPPSPFDLHARFLTPPGNTTAIPQGLGSTGALRDIRGFASTSQVDTFLVRLNGDNASGIFAQLTMSWPSNMSRYATGWTIKPRTGTDFASLNMLTASSLTFLPSTNQIDVFIIKSGTSLVDVEEKSNAVPGDFALQQNFPNPFNPSTAISYQLSAISNVTLTVFDLLGREVVTLVDGQQSAGGHTVTFDAAHLTSGIYFYELRAGSVSQIRQMMLLK